jgi:hypothetical protein
MITPATAKNYDLLEKSTSQALSIVHIFRHKKKQSRYCFAF